LKIAYAHPISYFHKFFLTVAQVLMLLNKLK